MYIESETQSTVIKRITLFMTDVIVYSSPVTEGSTIRNKIMWNDPET